MFGVSASCYGYQPLSSAANQSATACISKLVDHCVRSSPWAERACTTSGLHGSTTSHVHSAAVPPAGNVLQCTGLSGSSVQTLTNWQQPDACNASMSHVQNLANAFMPATLSATLELHPQPHPGTLHSPVAEFLHSPFVDITEDQVLEAISVAGTDDDPFADVAADMLPELRHLSDILPPFGDTPVAAIPHAAGAAAATASIARGTVVQDGSNRLADLSIQPALGIHDGLKLQPGAGRSLKAGPVSTKSTPVLGRIPSARQRALRKRGRSDSDDMWSNDDGTSDDECTAGKGAKQTRAYQRRTAEELNIDPSLPEEEQRKYRRMHSNRESARRSRFRKAQQLNLLQDQLNCNTQQLRDARAALKQQKHQCAEWRHYAQQLATMLEDMGQTVPMAPVGPGTALHADGTCSRRQAGTVAAAAPSPSSRSTGSGLLSRATPFAKVRASAKSQLRKPADAMPGRSASRASCQESPCMVPPGALLSTYALAKQRRSLPARPKRVHFTMVTKILDLPECT